MITFDGIYRLGRGPGSLTGGRYAAWRVLLVDFALSRPDVLHLRPLAVVATPLDAARVHTSCARSMGRRICRDFDLAPDAVLWVERVGGAPDGFRVAEFHRQVSDLDPAYSVTWRRLHPNEHRAIARFLPDARETDTARGQ